MINDIVPLISIHVILFHVFFSRKRTHSRKTSMKVSLFYYLKTLSSTWCKFFSKKNPKNGVLNTSFGARKEYLISAMFNFSNNFEHKSPFKPNFELLRSKWLFRHLKVFIGHSLKPYFTWKMKQERLGVKTHSVIYWSLIINGYRISRRNTLKCIKLFCFLPWRIIFNHFCCFLAIHTPLPVSTAILEFWWLPLFYGYLYFTVYHDMHIFMLRRSSETI